MVSKLKTKGQIKRTERRKKADLVHRNKQINAGLGKYLETDEDCDWTMDGSPAIESPYLPFLDKLVR